MMWIVMAWSGMEELTSISQNQSKDLFLGSDATKKKVFGLVLGDRCKFIHPRPSHDYPHHRPLQSRVVRSRTHLLTMKTSGSEVPDALSLLTTHGWLMVVVVVKSHA